MNMGNILYNIVSPMEHCYGFEQCYVEKEVLTSIFKWLNIMSIKRHDYMLYIAH